jgi:[ribosomal protein S18]-alanine N-acetyltransferase
VTATVRRALPADVAAIWAIEQAVFGSIVYPSFFFRQAHDLWGDLLQVAELPSGELAGYLLAAPSLTPGEAWIVSATVLPQQRGQGLGRRLVEATTAALAKRGFRTVRLTVHPDNAAAVRLYQRLGFEAGSVQPDYFGPGEPRLLMSLVMPE